MAQGDSLTVFNLTALYPVVCDNEVVAFISVEIPMLTLESDITAYIVTVLIASGIIMIVLLTAGVIFIIRTMIRTVS